jgi:tellurite resistance protein
MSVRTAGVANPLRLPLASRSLISGPSVEGASDPFDLEAYGRGAGAMKAYTSVWPGVVSGVMATPTTSLSDLETHAAQLRTELKVPHQNEVFRAAVEAGYLVATADGTFDDTERETLVKAIGILSVGAVIEWEVETLLEECAGRAKKEGAAKRAEAVGGELKKLGSAEAGLLLAAAVAKATKKVDKKEADTLKAVGVAAGLTGEQVAAIVKKAG